MDREQFSLWKDMLIEEAYDWKEIGISDDYCNKISVPKYGLRLINWPDKSFEVVDEQKYMLFLLRYR